MKLIKFGAEWCGPCRMMNDRLKNFNRCEVQFIDIDDETAETQKLIDEYQIMSVPVMVLLDDNDNVLKRWTGLTSLKDIEAACDEHKQN